MQEEQVSFEAGKIFYNPHMQLCRSFSSLLVGAIGEEISILDGFSATGIRGIRYAKENPNVSSLDLLDMDSGAADLSRTNAIRNGLDAEAYTGEFNSFMMDRKYDFIELDPFGSPAPFLYHAIRAFRSAKAGYISFTATDTAVLCGAHKNACKRIYHSTPLHDEIFHEAGTRILWKFASRIANEFNFGIRPLATLSHRHFFKLFLKLEKGSENALKDFSSTGYLTFCPSCGHREGGKTGKGSCPACGEKARVTGPLWLGELHDHTLLKRMQELNSERDYSHKKELSGLLGLMEGEMGMPPWFYGIHSTCSRLGIQPPPKKELLISGLKERGFRAAETHFSPTGVKTDAGIRDFASALKG
ncbi:MAG: tRNA (guanine(10)-N(2))-dimethyltransferase [Candidatus Micrarchaeia archaeon]